MPIIFDEIKHCEKLLNNDECLNIRVKQTDLKYLAKYWNYFGFNEYQVRRKLEEYWFKKDNNFNIIRNLKRIQSAVYHIRTDKLRIIENPVIITEEELLAIKLLNNYRKEKFVFTMLVSAKFFKQNKSKKKTKINKYENSLYSNSSIKDIKQTANINLTRKEWLQFKNELTLLGFISPTIMGTNCFALGFWYPDSKPIIIINDFRNIISYYQEYCGEKVIYCKDCGTRTVRRSNRQELCRDCWREKDKELKRNWWKKNKSLEV